MLKYARNPKHGKSVKVYGRNLRISTKHSVEISRAISNTTLAKSKRILQNLVDKKAGIDGKYYTKASGEMLDLIKSGESNAEFKGLEPEKMIVHASAHQGFSYFTPRRFKLARKRSHITNIQIVLEER